CFRRRVSARWAAASSNLMRGSQPSVPTRCGPDRFIIAGKHDENTAGARMAIPLCGTFRYVAVVPDNFPDSFIPWAATLCEAVERTGNERLDARLVGHSPRGEVNDADITPDSLLTPGQKARPRVLRSQIKLTAAERKDATVAAVSFHVDR